jgi:hypothetical protein
VELLKYELYKIYSRKMNYLALLVFLGVYLLFAQSTASRFHSVHDRAEVRSFLQKWEGSLTGSKVEAAERELTMLAEKTRTARIEAGQPLREIDLFPPELLSTEEKFQMAVYNDIVWTWSRLQRQEELKRQAAERLAAAQAADRGDFNYREAALQHRMLTSLEPAVFYYRRGWQEIIDFTNTLGLVFMGGMLLLALAPVFSEEYVVNMDGLLLSSRHGKRKVVTAKIAASLIVVVCLALIFSAVNVAANSYFFGLGGAAARLQELVKYLASPFNLTLGQYFRLQLATHIFGAASFGLLVLLISVFSRSPLIPFFIGGAVYGIPIFLGSILRIDAPWARTLVDFSYTQVVKVEQLFMTFRAFNVFGYPVLYVYLLCAVIALLSAAVLAGIYRGFRSRQVC